MNFFYYMSILFMQIYFIWFIFLLFFIVIFLIIYAFATRRNPNVYCTESEKHFIDPSTNNSCDKFPCIDELPSKDLSVIVPAYNEELRLPAMMDEALEYLNNFSKGTVFTYEIIVVDDGSNDKTSHVARSYTKKYGKDKVRTLTLNTNRGKGGAIKRGVFHCRGRYILFADADGATKFSDLDKLDAVLKMIEKKREDRMAIVCGSRAHLEKHSIANRSFFRTILMKGFHFIVWLFCVRSVQDTQCGFKLFTRPAASLLFRIIHVDRWAFDVDLLHVAEKLKIPIAEVPVTWNEIEGSKIIPVFSWLQMGKDILAIRLRYTLGIWNIIPISFDEIH